jgi:hypothetical protein
MEYVYIFILLFVFGMMSLVAFLNIEDRED